NAQPRTSVLKKRSVLSVSHPRLIQKISVIPNRFSGEEPAAARKEAGSSDLKVLGMTSQW
ncbi:MAG: hypothetical protein DMG92_13665, partial [Acidobacteria bacterium]